MTYVLHYAPDNASLIVRLALEEMGLAYETRLVDRATQAQFSPAHRALNPAGRIPVLEARGSVLFETAAILLWLDEQHGAPNPLPRSDYLKWLLFMSNDVQTLLRIQFYAERYTQGDVTLLRKGIQEVMTDNLKILEDAAQGPYFGGAFCSLDCYLAPLLRWCALYPPGMSDWFSLRDFPTLQNLAAKFENRDAVQKVAELEGLGPNPFTSPNFANPPEGSAF